jgi:hypothetical protein
MQTGANVRSIEAIRGFRAALVECSHEIRAATEGYRMEVQRGLDWILQQEPARWKGELRRAEEGVIQAKRDLDHRLSVKFSGQEVTAIEEKKALQRAKDRQRYVEEKQVVVKRYGLEIDSEATEYLAHSTQISTNLEAMFAGALAELDRALDALERYVALSGPNEKTTSVGLSPTRLRADDQGEKKERQP